MDVVRGAVETVGGGYCITGAEGQRGWFEPETSRFESGGDTWVC